MSKPNECPRLIEAHRLWEGEIEGRRAAEVRRHLEGCPGCRAAYDEWDRLSGLLARGDPAAPFAPARRQRMRAELLEACVAILDETSDSVRRSAPDSEASVWARLLKSAARGGGVAGVRTPRPHAGAPDMRTGRPHSGMAAHQAAAFQPDASAGSRSHPIGPNTPGAWPWRRSARIALALVPVALAGLWLAFAVRHAPPGKLPSTPIVSRSGATPVQREPEAAPRRQRLALNSGTLKPSTLTGNSHDHGTIDRKPGADADRKVGATTAPGAGTTPRRGGRSRRRAGALRLAAAEPHWRAERTRRRTVPAAAADQHLARSRESGPAARPIERLVIQVDAPAPAPRADTRTVTHLTVIAAGDLKAPGAQLTIVKSEKEEALP